MKITQIAERFAEGKKSGKTPNGSLFIDGEAIYSFGKHCWVARRHPLFPDAYYFNMGRFVLAENNRVSVTTEHHKNIVLMELARKKKDIIPMNDGKFFKQECPEDLTSVRMLNPTKSATKSP